MNTLTINADKATHVNVNGTWIRCTGLTFRTLAFGDGKPVPGVSFFDPDNGGGWVYAEASQVRGIRASTRIMTAEEIEAERAEAEEAETRLFEWQHYTDPKTYAKTSDRQVGKCAGCNADLTAFGITHLDPDGRLRCQGCTTRPHRYGSPA